MVQNDKKCFWSHSISQEPFIVWLSFYFFKFLIFRVVSWVKGQKIVHNDKKFCLSNSVSQEPCIIWSWFLVHVCKMMISPTVFFIFSKFWFFIFFRAVFLVSFALYLRNCRLYHPDFDNGICNCFSLFFF